MSTKIIVLILMVAGTFWVLSALAFIAFYMYLKNKDVDMNKILPLYKKDVSADVSTIIVGKYINNDFYINKGLLLVNPYDHSNDDVTLYLDYETNIFYRYSVTDDEYYPLAIYLKEEEK